MVANARISQIQPLSRTRSAEALHVEIASTAELPSEFGTFRLYVFKNNRDDKEHLAIVQGDVFGGHDIATRLHSECLTGDVLGSLRCDCRPQLELSLKTIAQMPRLTNKIRAYALQEQGMDTIDANLALGFGEDERDYSIAAAMLRELGVRSIELMTNNPDKVTQLESCGIRVKKRVSHVIASNPHNKAYLETKARRAGHLIDISNEPANTGAHQTSEVPHAAE